MLIAAKRSTDTRRMRISTIGTFLGLAVWIVPSAGCEGASAPARQEAPFDSKAVSFSMQEGNRIREALFEHRESAGRFPEGLDVVFSVNAITFRPPSVGTGLWSYRVDAQGNRFTLGFGTADEPYLYSVSSESTDWVVLD